MTSLHVHLLHLTKVPFSHMVAKAVAQDFSLAAHLTLTWPENGCKAAGFPLFVLRAKKTTVLLIG